MIPLGVLSSVPNLGSGLQLPLMKFSDSFNRPDGTALNGAMSDSAFGGTSQAWYNNASYVTEGNQLRSTSGLTRYAGVNIGTRDYTVSAKITALPSSGLLGLGARCSSGDMRAARIAIQVFPDGSLDLNIEYSGQVSLGTAAAGAVTPGSVLSLKCVGSELTVKVDGATVITAIDTVSPTPTFSWFYAGIMSNASSWRLDDFKVFVEEWSPILIPDLKIWLDAADLQSIQQESGDVSTWFDKAQVIASHLSQSNPNYKPKTGLVTKNSRNVMSFPGTAFLERSSGYAPDWKFMHDGTKNLVAVVAMKATTGNQGIFSTRSDGSGAPAGQWLYMNGSAMWPIVTKSGSNSIIASRTTNGYINTGVPFITTYLTDVSNVNIPSRMSLWKDENAASGITSALGDYNPAVTGVHPFVVGSLVNNGGYLMNGWIAEIVIVGGDSATEENRVLLRDYLNQKWAIY